jgi:hypothetical protein
VKRYVFEFFGPERFGVSQTLVLAWSALPGYIFFGSCLISSVFIGWVRKWDKMDLLLELSMNGLKRISKSGTVKVGLGGEGSWSGVQVALTVYSRERYGRSEKDQ